MIFLYCFLTLLILAPWLLFNGQRYHTMLPHNAYVLEQIPGNAAKAPATPKTIVSYARTTIVNFITISSKIAGEFDWINAPLFLPLRVFYTGFLSVFLLAGFLLLIRKGRKAALDHINFVSATAILLLLAFLIAYSIQLQRINFGLLLQARYFLPGLLPAGLLVFSGVSNALKKVSLLVNGATVARMLFYGSMFYFLAALLFTIIPYFYV